MPKILKETVVLNNYLGEVDEEAVYQTTVLKNVYVNMTVGAVESNSGKRSNDKGRLYIFDRDTKAYSIDGTVRRTYLPYSDFLKAEDKNKYWTLSDSEMDFLKKDNIKFKINSFSHKKAGSKRIWHFEVDLK